MGNYIPHKKRTIRRNRSAANQNAPVLTTGAAAKKEREFWDVAVAVRQLELQDKAQRALERRERRIAEQALRDERQKVVVSLARKIIPMQELPADLRLGRQDDARAYFTIRNIVGILMKRPTMARWIVHPVGRRAMRGVMRLRCMIAEVEGETLTKKELRSIIRLMLAKRRASLLTMEWGSVDAPKNHPHLWFAPPHIV